MQPAAGIIPKLLILVAFGVVLGLPWLFRPRADLPPSGAERLVIITPHNEQIRQEFGRGFDRWHREKHGVPVAIDWRVPGGTSDIRRLLTSQYTDAVRRGRITPEGGLRPGAEPMPYDLLFGGGSYEHGEVKRGVRVTPDGADREVAMPISVPMGFEPARLEEWFGPPPHVIGVLPLYDPGDPERGDPGQHWIGAAVSGFGIVFNRPALRALGLPDPVSWHDLTVPRLQGWVALADPRQSGSVATAYESILNVHGWDEGWRILRAMSANARYFTATSPRPPLDVSQGQAAVGVAIDFYGRYQSQALMEPGQTPETARVGYIDPPGETLIDPDPVSMLRAGPSPALARRFVEFLMSAEGQALWNFSRRAEGEALGPERFELRRMPIRRDMFTDPALRARLVDRVDPYEIATTAPNRGWRAAIGPMMGASAIDNHREMRRAWRAIHDARARGVSPALIEQAEALFFDWPEHTMADGSSVRFGEGTFRAVRADWREAERDGRWHGVRIAYTGFFRENYARIERMLERAPALSEAAR